MLKSIPITLEIGTAIELVKLSSTETSVFEIIIHPCQK